MLVLPLWFDVLARLTHLLVYCDLRLSRLLILTQEDVHGLGEELFEPFEELKFDPHNSLDFILDVLLNNRLAFCLLL